jgi:hypothetical protein
VKPSNVFQLELSAAVANRQVLAMRVGFALLLGLPIALVDMPPRARAGGVAMLVVFVALLGSAVAAVRRRLDGHWERLWLLPLPRWAVLLDSVLAASAVDLLQTVPVVLIFAVAQGGVALLDALCMLCVSVAVLNAVGMALACLVRSSAEVHLAGALSVGIVAFLSRVFPVPERLAGIVSVSAAISPVSRLASALGASGAAAQGPVAPPVVLLGLLIAAFALRSLE